MYGLMEKQFHNTFKKAEAQKGVTGTNLLQDLELRLDNVVYRMGFANSRDQARQLVRHGHFLLNGIKVDIPSMRLHQGDVLQVQEKSKKVGIIQEAQEILARRGSPQWLEIDSENYKGTVQALPQREDITFPINEHLIIELYSK
jgi:small subunit ribosomal protein S4